MDMETEALRWFQLVVDGMTVTEVADVHRVSQPGVSRALARLEAEVGSPLLQRTGRLLRPTYAGTVFKQHVDAMLHRLDDGLAAVSELVDPRTGTVAVAFQLSLGTWLVPGMIERFRTDYPRVEFRLEQSHDALGSSLVAGGRIDLEFTSRRPRNPAVRWERLFAQPLFLAVPRRHRLARLPQVSLAEAAGEDFVMLRPSWELRTLSDELCAHAGFEPRVAFEVDDLPVVHGFVSAGLGVGIVPATRGEPQPGGSTAAKLVRLTDPHASRDVGIAWSRDRRLLPSADLFRRHVLAARTGLED
ncbi:LysR family transcriptional regulator, transcription activator of glutamate synthase operon [Marmoricola sp. URHA0025 HA25]